MNNIPKKIILPISLISLFVTNSVFAASASISCGTNNLSPNTSTNCNVYVNADSITGYGPANLSTSGNLSISNLTLNTSAWQGSASGTSISAYSGSVHSGSVLVATFTLNAGSPGATSSESVSISSANLSDSNYNTITASGSSFGLTINVPVPEPDPAPNPEPAPTQNPEPSKPETPKNQSENKPATTTTGTENSDDNKSENTEDVEKSEVKDPDSEDSTKNPNIEVKTISATTPKGVKNLKKGDGSLIADLALVLTSVLASLTLVFIFASRAHKSADCPPEQ